MARELLTRYVWIVDTLTRYGRLSKKEIDERWARSHLSNGETEIPRRTFYNYRQAIEELFSLTIKCDEHTYEYYIDGDGEGADPRHSRMTEWLLNSSSTSSVVSGARDISNRVMLENVPSAREFLSPIMEAIRENHPVTFDYHPYTRVNPSHGVEIEPYFIRIYRQLWYVTGRNTADGKVKTYSLDRMKNLTIGTETFSLPPDADPELYFSDAVGIMVTKGEPREVRLRATARQAKYLRALPLHPSQREEVGDKHSVFTYRLLLTSELVSEIISRGPEITVVSPPELKAMVREQLSAALRNYEQRTGPEHA